jgi:RNA polymerase sigma-70 factor (ECF subfamily)
MIEPLALDITGRKRRSSSHTGALMNSSEDLIARARSGEHEAFRLIFERYAKPVLSFIHEMVGERDLAEELTQETFVRAFNNLGKLRDDSKLATWLFGIGKNVARESLRSRLRETLHSNERNAALESEDMNQISPSEELLGKELDYAIRRALHMLDADHRLVFVLKVYQQCRYDEIAEITGFSVGKVKTDLHRARVELRRRLRPFLEILR